jgi:hypothetical protein
VISKIGFLVHHRSVMDHYLPITAHINPLLYDFIVEDRKESLYGDQTPHIRNLVQNPHQIIPLSKCLAEDLQWKVGVSNHGYLDGLMKQISLIRVRQMYGLDDATWNYGPLNLNFDVALTHGPFDSNILKRRFGLRCLVMGYPKQIEFLKKKPEYRSDLAVQIKTIVWLPTFSPENSIADFASEFASLGQVYETFVRPHPLTFEYHPEQIELLKELGCNVIYPEGPSTQELISRSSISLHDFGGTAAAAIFLGRVPLFLNDYHIAEHLYTESPERLMRDIFGFVTKGELSDAIQNQLACSPLEIPRIRVKTLRQKFFADFSGQDAQVAAAHLTMILKTPYIISQLRASSLARSLRKLSASLMRSRSTSNKCH